MRFLLVANAPGSLVNFRLDFIKSVQAAGYEVHVACPQMDEAIKENIILEQQGVVMHSVAMSRVGLNPLSDFLTLWSLFRLMRKVQPSIFLGYTIKPVVWGSLAAFFARVPKRFSLITGLGYAFVDDEIPSIKRRFVRVAVEKLYLLSLSCCSRIFFQNPDDEQLFRDFKIIKNSTLTTVVKGSGVNLAHFKVRPLPEKPIFLLIARLIVDKGIREYASAAILLKARYPEVQFKLVGYLDENPKSIAQVELDSWVSTGAIEYLGKLSDVRPVLSAASVFVLPSFYREGIPRTILEALAMGRAIITTDTPGCRETVVHGVNGFFVRSKSVDELAGAMEQLILNPDLVIRMGAASHDLAVRDFDVNKVNVSMLNGMGVK